MSLTKASFSMINGASVNVLDFGAVGDAVTNDTAAIQAAIDYAASLAYGATVVFPPGAYLTTNTITLPYKVNLFGQAVGARSSTNQNYGSVIVKAHANNALLVNKTIAGPQTITNIHIEGNNAANTAGDGIVIHASGVQLKSCRVWNILGKSFVVGDGSGPLSAYSAEFDDCYANTTQGATAAYYIDSTDFRGRKLLSDGAEIAIDFTANATNWSIADCRFEGYSVAGGRAVNAQGVTNGRVYFAGTSASALYGFLVEGSASNIRLNGLTIDRGDIRTAGSNAIRITGAATGTIVKETVITNYDVGLYDSSSSSVSKTTAWNCVISGCNTSIYVNAQFGRYINNRFISSQVYDINHVLGQNGLWAENTFSLTGDSAINPALSGQSGNFGTNAVKNNFNYKTKNSGYLGSVASGDSISHGLAAAPVFNGSVISVTVHGTGLTSPIVVTNPTSTTFDVSWVGTTPQPLTWEARLMCDF